jgi:hypothetical protein
MKTGKALAFPVFGILFLVALGHCHAWIGVNPYEIS